MRAAGAISGGGLPLAFLMEGEEGDVLEVVGGCGLAQRLSDMGLTPSTRVRVIKAHPQGPLLLWVRDARVALGRSVAMKILVRRWEGHC